MVYPTSNDPFSLNALTSQISSLTKKNESTYLFRTVAIDQVMRNKVALIQEVCQKQLLLLKELLAASGDNNNNSSKSMDFTQIESRMNSLLTTIKSQHLISYEDLIKARDTYVDQGIIVPITKEIKEKLLQEFKALLDDTIVGYAVKIEPTSDLQTLVKKVEAESKRQLAIHEHLLNGKTGLTESLYTLEKEIQKLKVQKKQLSNVLASNKWQACENGDLKFLKEELTKVPQNQKLKYLNEKSETGYAPLHLAVFNQQEDIVEFLLENGADQGVLDDQGNLPIHWAAKIGNIKIAKRLLGIDKNFVCSKGAFDRTPLHYAVHNQHHEMTHFLISNGADINAQSGKEDGSLTPLHQAVILQNSDLALALVQNKNLDVNKLDANGHTPLYDAIYYGNSTLLALIIAHSSWKNPVSDQDPNHLAQLAKIKPKQNEKEIVSFLSTMGYGEPKKEEKKDEKKL